MKKKLEEKLKISSNTRIHCPTLELAKQVLNIFHKLGLKWNDETSYILCTNWDSFKENTVYCPFDGQVSSFGFNNLIVYKIISAEEFIDLHTEFNLENYVPKGELTGFPKEIISRMLDCQVEQGNPRNVSVFEKDKTAAENKKGFVWRGTKEDYDFWSKVIVEKDFNFFFKKYPQKDNQDNSQEFRVGDKVIDIILDLKGKIINIKSNGNLEIQFEGKCGLTEYNLKIEKRASLLHYREDYNYDVIDFNNLPQRQEVKMWRAEKDGVYYFVNFHTDGWFFCKSKDDHDYPIDNNNYNSGNYFRTEVEAEIIAQKLNKYFQELINQNKELW